MNVDGETVVQVTVSVAVVLAFIAALTMLSLSYGTQAPIENESIEESLSGEFEGLEETNDGVAGQFEGNLRGAIDATITGDVEGEVRNGQFVGEFDGTIDGAVEGTAWGEVNGTVDEEVSSFDGTFSGTINGTDHGTQISPDGGLALVGLIALFIVVMPIFGFLIERYRDDEE